MLSKSCQKVVNKLSKTCQSCQSCLELGWNRKFIDHVLFLNKVWGEVGGWAKSGSKAFGDYFVVSRRQKEFVVT
jgi:hypothetical protein